jgi:endonuclease/exonuclease/phosphatase family metal-dependent hydrolase
VHGSIAAVASSGRVGLAMATFVVCSGSALAVFLGSRAARNPGRTVGAVAAALLAIVTWWSRTITGDVVLVLSVVAQVLTAVLLVAVLAEEPAEPRVRSLARTATGATAGFVAMFALTLLHPMHYEMPLPVTNEVLPLVAIGLTALCLLASREHAEPSTTPRAIVPALALTAGAAVVALMLIATAHQSPALATARWPLVVGSLNVDQGARESGAIDFAAVADVLDTLDADVVALQEVGRGWPLSGMNDLALWLEHERGSQQYFAPAADEQFGNLLMFRVDVDDIRTLELPRGGGSMDRSAIVATVPTPNGDVRVYAVHLQHRNSAASIEARRAELAVVLDDWAGAPRTVVVGDLNANNQRSPDGGPKVLVGPDQANTLQPLLDAGFSTTQPTQRCTLPTSNDNCSDFVFVTPDLLQVPPVLVLDPAPIGDHRPIRSEITQS